MTIDLSTAHWRAVIPGEPATQAESRTLVMMRDATTRKLRPQLVMSEAARGWLARALFLLAERRPLEPFDRPLRMDCTIFYASERSMLDAALVMEALQSARVVAHARLLREIHLHHAVDRAVPRTEVALSVRRSIPSHPHQPSDEVKP